MNYDSLIPITGIIQNISQTPNDCCHQFITVRTPNGIYHFVVSPDTIVIGNTRLRPRMPIAAFYDASLPVPLIFPPQYQAQLLAPLRGNETVMLNFFQRNLTAADNSLRLNLDRSTEISTINGQPYPCPPDNQYLLVYYSATTRSIPPQTTPRKIVVLCQGT